MALTANIVQTDVINLIKGTALAESVSGSVYRGGLRPRDSRLEDIVAIFTTGTADQIETGVVTINIFVPDIDAGDGIPVENMARTAEIEALAQQWFDGLSAANTDYLFSLRSSIYTETEPDTREHFVVIRLSYRHFNSNF